MAASNPQDGTLYIAGTDVDGGAETLQWGNSVTGDPIPTTFEGGVPVTFQFQSMFGVEKVFPNAKSIWNNVRLVGVLKISEMWVTTAEWKSLERLFQNNDDGQLTVEFYVDADAGANYTAFFFDNSTASKIANTTIRTAKKMRFSQDGITVRYVGTQKDTWAVSFTSVEDNG